MKVLRLNYKIPIFIGILTAVLYFKISYFQIISRHNRFNGSYQNKSEWQILVDSKVFPREYYEMVDDGCFRDPVLDSISELNEKEIIANIDLGCGWDTDIEDTNIPYLKVYDIENPDGSVEVNLGDPVVTPRIPKLLHCKIPKVVHIIMGPKFKYYNYLAIKSAYDKIKPWIMYVYTDTYFPEDDLLFQRAKQEFGLVPIRLRQIKRIYSRRIREVYHL